MNEHDCAVDFAADSSMVSCAVCMLASLRRKPRCDWTQALYQASPLTMLHVVCLMHHWFLDISTLRRLETVSVDVQND
jgi:hypothetical protein